MPQRDMELDLTFLGTMMTRHASRNKIALKEALSNPRFAQVGINLFRDQVDNCIWAIQKGEDGSDYIIRSEVETNPWTTHTDVTAETLTVAFHGVPIYKFAGQDFGFNKGSIVDFKQYIMKKVEEPSFVKSLYAFITNKCPNCGRQPESIGLNEIRCNCNK
jgi:hypothetical protein